MKDGTIPARNRLKLNRTIFFVATIFLYGGLISGTLSDLANSYPLVLLSDLVAFVVFTATIVLVVFRKISYGAALMICLVQTCLNFVWGTVVVNSLYPSNPEAWVANPQWILLFSLFGIVAGISINRYAALVFGFFAMATIAWFSISFHNSDFYKNLFVLESSAIMGALILVFYYRRMLEILVHKLGQSLEHVRDLKNRAEVIHEQNKPFVVFGQNTAGLVNDFQNDVLVLDSEMGTLRGDLDDKMISASLATLSEAIRNLNQRIEWVKFVSSATSERSEELINVKKLIESALYPFSLQKDPGDFFSFTVEIPHTLHVRAFRRWLLQAIENLVRNSRESGASRIRVRATVDSADFADLESIKPGEAFRMMIELSYDGQVMGGCSDCPEADCMQCPGSQRALNSNQISQNTMAVRALEALGGTLEIDSHPQSGTKIRLFLDHAVLSPNQDRLPRLA